jgi:hypothetical protein
VSLLKYIQQRFPCAGAFPMPTKLLPSSVGVRPASVADPVLDVHDPVTGAPSVPSVFRA